MGHNGGIPMQTFPATPIPGETVAAPALEVLAYPPKVFQQEHGSGRVGSRFTQTALYVATQVGIIINRAEADRPNARPAPVEALAQKLATPLGMYALTRQDDHDSAALAYGCYAAVPQDDGDMILRFFAAEAIDPERGLRRCRRAVAALMIAASEIYPPETPVRVDGHQEIAETRSGDFFWENGFELGPDSPPWGTPGAYCVNTVGQMNRRFAQNYGLEWDPRESIQGVDYT